MKSPARRRLLKVALVGLEEKAPEGGARHGEPRSWEVRNRGWVVAALQAGAPGVMTWQDPARGRRDSGTRSWVIRALANANRTSPDGPHRPFWPVAERPSPTATARVRTPAHLPGSRVGAGGISRDLQGPPRRRGRGPGG